VARAGKVHFRVRNRKRTACDLLIRDRTRVTTEASQVTCDRCLRSYAVADYDMQVSTFTQEQP